MVKDLEENVIIEFLKERFSNGIFVNLSNFVDRVAISLEQLALLIRVGGFRFTSKSKKELLWEAYFLLGDTKKSKPLPMFCDTKPQPFELPPLYSDDLEDAFEEMELLGFPLISPFALLKDEISITTKVADLPGSLNKQITILGYLVTIKNTSTTSKKRMHFGTFIDLEGNFIDTVHFPPVAAKYPFRGRGIYKITGKVVEEFDFYTIEVTSMYKEDWIDDPRYFDNNSSQGQVNRYKKNQKNLLETGEIRGDVQIFE